MRSALLLLARLCWAGGIVLLGAGLAFGLMGESGRGSGLWAKVKGAPVAVWAWIKSWAYEDGWSSLIHGLVTVAAVLLGAFVLADGLTLLAPHAKTLGAGIGYGGALFFYGRKEWDNIRFFWQAYRKGSITLLFFGRKLGDGLLDMMFPVVFGGACTDVVL